MWKFFDLALTKTGTAEIERGISRRCRLKEFGIINKMSVTSPHKLFSSAKKSQSVDVSVLSIQH